MLHCFNLFFISQQLSLEAQFCLKARQVLESWYHWSKRKILLSFCLRNWCDMKHTKVESAVMIGNKEMMCNIVFCDKATLRLIHRFHGTKNLFFRILKFLSVPHKIYQSHTILCWVFFTAKWYDNNISPVIGTAKSNRNLWL